MMRLCRTIAETGDLQGCCLVPTMGALHAGHGVLIDEAKKYGDKVVVTIFVNPKQFGPTEDYEHYPRSLETDLEYCDQLGVTAVFAPSVDEMYPSGFATRVSVAGAEETMEGKVRPGHFTGVATVVARIFGIFRPAASCFGWKDAQQLFVIRRMTEDLALRVRIVPVETVREPDGLALSSRNVRLSAEERALSPELYRALRKGKDALREGARPDEIITRTRRHLKMSGLDEDYVEISGDRLCAAVRMASVRLIDNISLT